MSLTMSKLTDESPSYTRVARLTTTGDGREAAQAQVQRRRQQAPITLTWDDTAVSDEDEDDEETGPYGYGHAPAEEVPYSNIQEIIPGLFIGDVTAAMDHELLKSKNITVIIAASRSQSRYNLVSADISIFLPVRQRYTAPEVCTLPAVQRHRQRKGYLPY